jgi:hypothetical protein
LKWDFYGLCNNLFDKHPGLIRRKKQRMHERVAFLSCKEFFIIPPELVRYITSFI